MFFRRIRICQENRYQPWKGASTPIFGKRGIASRASWRMETMVKFYLSKFPKTIDFDICRSLYFLSREDLESIQDLNMRLDNWTYNLNTNQLWLMSLVAHWFGCIEFWIFVVVFYRQAQLKKIKTNIQNSTSPNWWATKDIMV